MSIFTLAIILFRLWIQNFSTPEFRVEDNPFAAEPEVLTRILSQNYLYSFNFYLLLMPEWLCFDWSFDSIERIKEVDDLRMIAVGGFYLMLLAVVVKGFNRR